MEPRSSSRQHKTTPKRKKTVKPDSSYPKITMFMSPKDGTKNVNKFEPLNVTVSSQKHKKKLRSARKDSISNGVVIPSYEKILADRKKFDEHKESVKLLDVFDETLLDDSLVTYRFPETQTFSGELLDCKSLSLDQLQSDFEKHLETLKGIMTGAVLSERHDSYEKAKKGEASMDLKVSNSVAVFTQEQNEHLLDLITKKLDPEDKLVGYCFKVLWPELCFRIFIDHHGMDAPEAKTYLEKRPLDN